MNTEYVKKMLEARVYDVAIETPISEAPSLSERLGNEILIKREDMQPIHSFKLRGAYNKITALSADQLKNGVIAASAGNHAQGVALSAQRLGIKSIIVMPNTTPSIKIKAVKALGSEVKLFGDTFDQALVQALALAETEGYAFIHPYDDPDVIAGQGTVAMEILRQHSGPLDAIFIPVGGGGLIAGMALYIKYLRPELKVVGVEAEESACLAAAMKANARVTLPEVGVFADGVAVAQIGKVTFDLCREYVDEVVTVSNAEICAAIKDLFNDVRSISEPAGALGLAGLKKYVEKTGVRNQTLMTVETGANVNFDKLRYISDQAEIGEHCEAIYAVEIPECPGRFREFVVALDDHNITEFNYRYVENEAARIFVGIQISDGWAERRRLVTTLSKKNYKVIDLTEDEMAKGHVRHMVGGHSRATDKPERVFLIEFPERKGALIRFLDALNDRWNVSLFHYRSEGALYGRVMVGFHVDDAELPELTTALDTVSYHYREQTTNPAYQHFLS